jgi:hypothetical protein
VAFGARWLHQQVGRKVVFVPGKANYTNNSLLPSLTAGAAVLTMRNRHRQPWPRGPILVCWPTEEMLDVVSDQMRYHASPVCVLEWGDAPYQRAWLAAHGAIDVTTGQLAAVNTSGLSTVVLVAMENLSAIVNHGNSLVGTFDKELAIETLQALVRGGHRYEVEELCSWALANGFTGREVQNLRDYASKALAGHRFRTTGRGALRKDILKVWEEEAQMRASSTER